MFFIILTFCAALFIEGLGSLVSVIGISALFGANPIIIALAIALDVGKVVTVSLLYTYWKTLSKLMKSYALLAATVTMVITSTGAAGYLSGEFQKAIVGTKEGELKVNVLKEQQAKYQLRKKQIDDQIAALPTKTTVGQRLRLMNGFKAEQKSLDEKITQIDKELPDQQVKQIGTEAKAGPILYVAKAFNISVEEAVKWVILMIIFVFDPLAIFLIIAGNFLWARHKAAKAAEPASYRVEMEDGPLEMPQPTRPAPPPPVWKEHKSPEPVKIDEPTPVPKETEYTRFDPPVEPVKSTLETPSPDPMDHYGHSIRAVPVEHIVEEPEDIPEPVDTPQTEPEPEPVADRRTYVQTGILKPVTVESPNVDENDIDKPNFTPMTIEKFVETTTPAIIDQPMVQSGPVLDDELPEHREEITRSSLGLTPADPHTVVDAQRSLGFRKATVISKQ